MKFEKCKILGKDVWVCVKCGAELYSIEEQEYHLCQELIEKPTKQCDGGGLRFNDGKPMLHLVPKSIKVAIARVLEYGFKREVNPYPPNNWRRGMGFTKVINSLMRHIEAYNEGVDNDEDSGMSHLWHAACNIAFLIEYEETCPELDDRFKGGKK